MLSLCRMKPNVFSLKLYLQLMLMHNSDCSKVNSIVAYCCLETKVKGLTDVHQLLVVLPNLTTY